MALILCHSRAKVAVAKNPGSALDSPASEFPPRPKVNRGYSQIFPELIGAARFAELLRAIAAFVDRPALRH